MDPRPEDRLEAEVVDGAGELGFFPPYSWWPLWCACALAVCVLGVVFGWWLFIIGVGAGLDRSDRLGVRVLPRRARPLSLGDAWDARRRLIPVRPAIRVRTGMAATTFRPLVRHTQCQSGGQGDARGGLEISRCPPCLVTLDAHQSVASSREYFYVRTGDPFPPAVVAVAVAALSLALAGCNGSDAADDSDGTGPGDKAANNADPGSDEPQAPATSAAVITANVSRSKPVTVDTPVTVTVADGIVRRRSCRASSRASELPGSLQRRQDRVDRRLPARARHALRRVQPRLRRRRPRASSPDAVPHRRPHARPSRPTRASRPSRARPSVSACRSSSLRHPGHRPRGLREADEGHRVAEDRGQLALDERPGSRTGARATYWQPGTKVVVDLNVNSVNAGNGVYGQMDRHLELHRSATSVVMQGQPADRPDGGLVNGTLARDHPDHRRQARLRDPQRHQADRGEVRRASGWTPPRSGIEPGDPEYYDIPDVQYAQRVTFTGEFLHAAPWSVSAQGSYNVVHGCVGMSTDERRLAVQPHAPGRPGRGDRARSAASRTATAGPTGTCRSPSTSRAQPSDPRSTAKRSDSHVGR